METSKEGSIGARAWILLFVLLLLYVFMYLDRAVLALVVDPVRKTMGLSDSEIGLLIGLAVATAYAIAGVPFGWLVDRFDRRYVLFAAAVFWGLATAACGFAQNFQQFFIARMFVGAGEAGLMPAAHSLIANSFPRKRLGLALSIYTVGASVGAGVSLVVGGFVVQAMKGYDSISVPGLGETDPWRGVFLASGLMTLLAAFLMLLMREPPRAAIAVKAQSDALTDDSTIGMFGFLKRNWKIWLMFTVVFGGMNVINAALIFWQPSYMSRFFHWQPAQYGLALGATYALAGAAGLLFSGVIIDKLYARGVKDAPLRYYLWALIISTPIVIVALLAPNVWVYLGLIWVAKFATVNFFGLGSLAVQLTTPSHLRGRMAGLFATVIISLLGTSLGASAPALIAQHVLHDEVRIGASIAATLAICAPLAIGALFLGLKPFRAAVLRAESWGKPQTDAASSA
jgi:MFS family permease